MIQRAWQLSRSCLTTLQPNSPQRPLQRPEDSLAESRFSHTYALSSLEKSNNRTAIEIKGPTMLGCIKLV